LSLLDMLDRTMTILSFTKTSDAYGGYTATSAASNTGVPCRLQPLSGIERDAYRGEKVEEVFSLYFRNGDATLTADDEIGIGTGTYEVESVLDNGGRDHHWKGTVRHTNPWVK